MQKINKKRIFIITTALALTICICFALIGCNGINRNSTDNDVDNENHFYSLDDDTVDVFSGEDEAMASNEVYSMPARMIFKTVSAQSSSASNGVTIKASITPAYAVNTAVDWSVSWVNPNSTWASGKTASSYCSVTPESNGSLIATVRSLQPFGEQIKVVATSRLNSSVSASCTADFVKQIQSIYGGTYIDSKNEIQASSSYYWNNNDSTINGFLLKTDNNLPAGITPDRIRLGQGSLSIYYTAGTLERYNESTIKLARIRLHPLFIAYVKNTLQGKYPDELNDLIYINNEEKEYPHELAVFEEGNSLEGDNIPVSAIQLHEDAFLNPYVAVKGESFQPHVNNYLRGYSLNFLIELTVYERIPIFVFDYHVIEKDSEGAYRIGEYVSSLSAGFGDYVNTLSLDNDSIIFGE